MRLHHFKAEDFLANYWQKQACVIRQAFAEPFWLEPDELAGLSLESEVESRLIRQVKQQWLLEHGPFTEQRFQELGDKDWTLLVQGVDQWVPEVRALLSAFCFLPRWRLDDVMVSFAPEGGTVSQHFDYYDVFLIQGEGRRRWQVGQVCDEDSELLGNHSVKILKEFTPLKEYVLEPGDVLYIPARHAHLGVSLENSLTYSIGFRAPSMADMLHHMTQEALEIIRDDQRYLDTATTLKALQGEIPAASIAAMRESLQAILLNDELLQRCFGRCVTEAKYPEINAEYHCSQSMFEASDWEVSIDKQEVLYKSPHSRFAYIDNDGHIVFFADGESYACSLSLAQHLANHETDYYESLHSMIKTETDKQLILSLLRIGALSFESFD